MHTQAGRDQAPICVHSSTGQEGEVRGVVLEEKAQAAAMAAWADGTRGLVVTSLVAITL